MIIFHAKTQRRSFESHTFIFRAETQRRSFSCTILSLPLALCSLPLAPCPLPLAQFFLGGAALSRLWHLADDLTPHQRTGPYVQAMMDLGATFCTRSKPLCLYCPLQGRCQAFALGTPTAFPGKKAAKVQPVKAAFFLLIGNERGEYLWVRRPPSGIWGGMWCLPEAAVASEAELRIVLNERYGIQDAILEHLPPFRHTFSHYHLRMQPVRVKAALPRGGEGESSWLTPQQAQERGLPAPLLKLCRDIR